MAYTEKTVGILNDLVEINNDRAEGFKKAIVDLKEENTDLKAIFADYAAQSEKFSRELGFIVAGAGEEVEKGESVSGTLHRAWIDIKSIFGADDRKSILNEAERGEDAIKAAYEKAIRDGSLDGPALEKVSTQAIEIKAAHDKIKSLRDASR